MIRPPSRVAHLILLSLVIVTITGCASKPRKQESKFAGSKPGTRLQRSGDEIVVAGQFFHTGAPVVLWTDPGGYDAYRVERRFAPWDEAGYAPTTQKVKDIDAPARYGLRTRTLEDAELEKVRGGGWPLELLQDKVDQFVIHYDVAGTSRQCFKILHDIRGLSVQFMLDLDGTIYQTCDAKEAAWHATKSNHRSVGIEIANMGAYPSTTATLKEWYSKDKTGRTRITIPARFGDGGIRNKDIVLRPIREELIAGQVHGTTYRQYDLTPQQYDSLTKLTAALCTALPRIECDYPRDENGELIRTNLADDQWQDFSGVMGHWHVQRNKQDPGPAFQWDLVIDGARELMGKPPKPKTGNVRPSTQPSTQPTSRPSRFAREGGAR
jgi:N-acetylmuramoyl-L-alanine amidase